MIRRTIFAIGVIGAASAAGALAFASEISRAGQQLVERATWLGQGFTAVPAQWRGIHGKDGRSNLSAPDATAKGNYCRFPASGDAGAVVGAHLDSSLVVPGSSSARLLLEGQSTIPDSTPPALCTGDSAMSSPLLPRLGKP